MPRQLYLITLMFITLVACTLRASVPSLMNYQGVLAAANGQPLDGNYDLTFAVYDSPEGGQALWQEAHIAVPVSNGTFSIMLGGLAPIPPEVFSEAGRWIGIRVNDAAELTPRQQFGSVPFALHALSAENLGDGVTRPRVIRCFSDDEEASGGVGVIKSVTIPANTLTDFFTITLLVDAIGSTSDFCEREYELQLRVNGTTIFSTTADTLYKATLLAATAAKHADPNSWFIHKVDSQYGVIVEFDVATEITIELLGVLPCGTGSGSAVFRRMVVEYSD